MYAAAIGGGVNALASMATAALNNRYAKEAAERSYNYSLQYHRNAPKAQRMGLEAAGYNPMLALGNIGAGTFSGGGQTAQMEVPDIVGGAKAGAEIVQNIVKGYKLQNKKTEKEIENLESDLSTKETQRLQTEANTSLALSQTERSDLAYGRDIVGTAVDIAGTAGSLYSAKAMRDIARAPTETVTTIHHGDKTKPTEIIKNRGKPAVQHSPKAPTPNVGGLGHSAKSVGKVAGDLAKMVVLPAAFGGLAAEAVSPFVKEIESLSRKDIERNSRKSPIKFPHKRPMEVRFGM